MFSGSSVASVRELIFHNNDLKLLVTGDERGEIKAWCLRNFFLVMGIKPAEVSGDKLIYSGYEHPSKFFEHTTMVHYESPFVLSKWSAHTKAITALELCQDSNILLSGSKDGRVRCWSLEGQYFGTLRQAWDGGTWMFPLNETRKKIEDKAAVNTLLAEIGPPPKTPAEPVEELTTQRPTTSRKYPGIVTGLISTPIELQAAIATGSSTLSTPKTPKKPSTRPPTRSRGVVLPVLSKERPNTAAGSIYTVNSPLSASSSGSSANRPATSFSRPATTSKLHNTELLSFLGTRNFSGNAQKKAAERLRNALEST